MCYAILWVGSDVGTILRRVSVPLSSRQCAQSFQASRSGLASFRPPGFDSSSVEAHLCYTGGSHSLGRVLYCYSMFQTGALLLFEWLLMVYGRIWCAAAFDD